MTNPLVFNKKRLIGQSVAPCGFAFLAISVCLSANGLQAKELNPDISVVLDGMYIDNPLALGHGGPGFALGHNELSLGAPIDDLFIGRLTTVIESHDGETELELEEAYLRTTGLGYGLNVKAGRFLSAIGYLNSQHTHSDRFSTRPAVYRSLLGSHYFDDGLQLNLTLPTDLYWRVTAEALQGDAISDVENGVGLYTLSTKLGGDLSASQSWQAGLSYMKNRSPAIQEEEHDHADDEDEEHDHAGHSHGLSYYGGDLYAADLVWKWAPQGNNRQQQVELSAEYFYVDELNDFADEDDFHEGWYVAAVWRFAPQWSTGVRYGEVDLRQPHGDHFHSQSLRESDVMLSYSHSHFSTIRLQYTRQTGEGFSDIDSAILLQYVMSFGEHGAHEF
ncbi:hypothetical protein [Hahella chejuensis]|nr:hypothetical protein [Hahella chejuensis]